VQRSGDLLRRELVVEAKSKEHLIGGRQCGERRLQRIVQLERARLLVRTVRIVCRCARRVVELLDAEVVERCRGASSPVQ
jgi:hypothetical protein